MIVPAIVASLIATATGAAAADGAVEEPDERSSSISVSAYRYFVPDQPDFAMAIVSADLPLLHFEGRYNYEAVRSASAFIGVNARWRWRSRWHWVEELKLVVTPMFGGVAGDLDGLVPALRLTLAWWKLELVTESEIVVDVRDRGSSFFYNWSELGASPLSWFRAGAAIQRTRAFRTPLDVQRGVFASGTVQFATLTLYEFNLGWTAPTWVLALTLSF